MDPDNAGTDWRFGHTVGYTHYATFARPITEAEVTALADDIGKIIGAAGVPVAAEYDNPLTPPVLGPTMIAYNGVGDDGHETFYIAAGETSFSFCKTARKPYDVVVVASLLALKDRLGSDVRVSSDGDLGDWSAGYWLALRSLERLVPSPASALDYDE